MCNLVLLRLNYNINVGIYAFQAQPFHMNVMIVGVFKEYDSFWVVLFVPLYVASDKIQMFLKNLCIQEGVKA